MLLHKVFARVCAPEVASTVHAMIESQIGQSGTHYDINHLTTTAPWDVDDGDSLERRELNLLAVDVELNVVVEICTRGGKGLGCPVLRIEHLILSSDDMSEKSVDVVRFHAATPRTGS